MRLALAALVLVLGCPSAMAADAVVPTGFASAVFAGGCFWCIESDFEKLADQGVLTVTSGYSGGTEKNPTYQQVSAHKTSHAEVVKVVYDPKKISYEKLVHYFLRHIDPTQKDGQFCDWGKQYRSAIYYADDAEKKIAEAQVALAQKDLKVKGAIVTEIAKASEFWPAENYHQDYAKKEPAAYARYRSGCGRDARVAEVWGAQPAAH
jgi:peptide-methionine (S)-S-oxide reductase